jgi:phospholipid/cholesterol/gamma-HCH transport system substrate-binding protein
MSAGGGRRGMTLARGAAFAALAVAVVAVAWLLMTGDGGTDYKVRFQTATLLVKDNDVQVGGRRIGSIKDIRLTDNNEAEVTINVSKEFAPLHDGTRAAVRATSLSGIANRYIALTPGPQSAAKIDDGATITADKTTSPVSLDQLFNTLDAKTRHDLQQVIQGSATWYQGKGKEANAAAKYFNPALSTTSTLVRQVVRDQRAFEDFIINSSSLVGAIAERRDDLAALVGNANATTSAIASENASFDQALALLPTTLRRANSTFVNLRAALDDLDPLVAASKPATKRLAEFLKELRPLVDEAVPTINDLRYLVSTPGPGNDLTDLTKQAPKLQQTASPSIKASVQALKDSQKVIDFIRPYAPDFVGWLRDFGQGASNYDANGHYARIQPAFNTFAFTDNPAGGVLTPIGENHRLDGLLQGQLTRCPGAASQPPADGSAPWRGETGTLDCDPNQVLPGP